LGTDTGGSIRVPSSLCGVVGLKPTYGRISRYGVMDLAPSLDHLGCITRSVWDAAVVLQTIAGQDPFDAFTENEDVPDYRKIILETTDKKLSIGLPNRYFFDNLQAEVKEIIHTFFEDIGLSDFVFEINMEKTENISETWRSIRFAEAAEIHLKWLKTKANDYAEDVKNMLIEGTKIPAIEYIRAQKLRNELRYELLKLLKKVDVIVVPTTIITAPRFDDLEVSNIDGKLIKIREALLRNTIVFNITGLPSVSIPVGLSKDGMPVGVQIVGSPFKEEKILSLAYKYECVNNSLEKFVPPLH
ncbi:MAG TPA: amidase, partial [Nitrososphaeraceae archaeon]|nr:amidase [Nitrososphaeraceae archaeon]